MKVLVKVLLQSSYNDCRFTQLVTVALIISTKRVFVNIFGVKSCPCLQRKIPEEAAIPVLLSNSENDWWEFYLLNG